MKSDHPGEVRTAAAGRGAPPAAPLSRWLGLYLGLGAAVISLAAIAAAACFLPVFSTAGGGDGAWPAALSLPELRADLGDGDYIFLPNRRNMWVVNRSYGRIVHYKFLDTLQGTVERSHVAQINQTHFPPDDTSYLISERNITDLLWVCNRRTGDFQLWRINVRDGRLVTDRNPVVAARDLLRGPLQSSTLPDGERNEGTGPGDLQSPGPPEEGTRPPRNR